MIVYRETLHVELDGDGYYSIYGTGRFEGHGVMLQIPFVSKESAEMECRAMRREQHEAICIQAGRSERTGILADTAGDKSDRNGVEGFEELRVNSRG